MNVQNRLATLISTVYPGGPDDVFTKSRQRVSHRTVQSPGGMGQNLDLVS